MAAEERKAPKPIYCACGAQWHGEYTTSSVIAAHKERWAREQLGCRSITHAEYRRLFKCMCEACQTKRRDVYWKKRVANGTALATR